MSAHDQSTRAHDTTPPGDRPSKSINVDETGISMSWRTAVAVIGFIVFVMMAWNTFAASLLKAADLADHNARSTAHAKHPGHEDRIKRAEVVAMVKPIQEEVEATSAAVIKVQNGFYDQRAADLAYRAVEKLPRSAPTRARIRRFERVKGKALRNQQEGRDILDGIDVPVM